MSDELLFKVSCLNKLNQIDGMNWTTSIWNPYVYADTGGMWRKRDAKNNKIFCQALM